MKELDVHVVLSILTSGNAYNGKIDCNIQLILFDIFLKILNRIPHRDRLIVSAKFKFMMKRIHFFAHKGDSKFQNMECIRIMVFIY